MWALHEGGMINLILYIASSENEQQYYFHVLEVSYSWRNFPQPELFFFLSISSPPPLIILNNEDELDQLGKKQFTCTPSDYAY